MYTAVELYTWRRSRAPYGNSSKEFTSLKRQGSNQAMSFMRGSFETNWVDICWIAATKITLKTFISNNFDGVSKILLASSREDPSVRCFTGVQFIGIITRLFKVWSYLRTSKANSKKFPWFTFGLFKSAAASSVSSIS